MQQTEYFIERRQYLYAKITKLEAELKHYSEGRLICYQTGKDEHPIIQRYKVLTKDGRQKRTYLSNKNIKEAKELAEKTYKYRLLNDMKNEYESINAYLSHRKPEHHSKMLAPDSPYRNLLCDNDGWEFEDYEKNQNHPEHLIIPAPKGDLVRSKSEAMIAHMLFEHHIPYRYEYVQDIDGISMAPDFTILHPKTSLKYVWEHFGLMDNEAYINSVAYKLPKYVHAGYLPGNNMIMTFEDTRHPLSYMEVEDIVVRYFEA